MPLRPFPFPLRVGNDICSIKRISHLIAKNQSSLSRFLPKLLTLPERQYFYHRFQRPTGGSDNHADESLQKTAQFLAGRWAAKEAVRKACEHVGLSNGFHHIIILPDISSISRPGETSRPQALILRDRFIEPSEPPLEGANTRTLGLDVSCLDGQLCELSISHDTEYATAVALVPVVEEWQSQAITPDNQDGKA